MALERYTGRIKSFNDLRGFGFIQIEKLDGDIFVHSSKIRADEGYTPRVGDAVTLSLLSRDDGRLFAIDVVPVHPRELCGADPACANSPTVCSGHYSGARQDALRDFVTMAEALARRGLEVGEILKEINAKIGGEANAGIGMAHGASGPNPGR